MTHIAVDRPATPAAESGHHAHHWETSIAPFAVVFGIFFLVPLGFSAWFVYESPLLAALFAGIGVPLLLYGVAKWVAEGMSQAPLVPGLAAIGLPVFIVSEVFVFLGLFSAYWMMRLGMPAWPPAGTPDINLVLPLVMTALLVGSSVTIHIGEEKLAHQGDVAGFRKWLWITLALGFVFVGCTVYEYAHLAGLGFVPSTNAYSTAFFSITGFHAAHVFLGLLAFVAVLIPAIKGRTNDTFIKCVSIYWHFVDVVWFFVVTQIYFW